MKHKIVILAAIAIGIGVLLVLRRNANAATLTFNPQKEVTNGAGPALLGGLGLILGTPVSGGTAPGPAYNATPTGRPPGGSYSGAQSWSALVGANVVRNFPVPGMGEVSSKAVAPPAYKR